MATDGRPATGVDASPQMVAIARGRLRRAGYPAHLTRAIAQQLPFAESSFDTLLATFPAEYITDPQTHAEMRRVLVPSGRVVILPLAQLDTSLYAQLVDRAYRVILQAPPARDHQQATLPAQAQIGDLSLRAHWMRVGPSQALVLVGDLKEN
ncbi:MAG: class I SAM-dependent methyltransferase [Oscillochloris sp.]|nr:class I SAM-dependent methyltransferase [Oscillochloris sp.]